MRLVLGAVATELLPAMAGAGARLSAAAPEHVPGIFARGLEGLTGLVGQIVSVEIRSSEGSGGHRHPGRVRQGLTHG